jgi:ParB-like nuclease domain
MHSPSSTQKAARGQRRHQARGEPHSPLASEAEKPTHPLPVQSAPTGSLRPNPRNARTHSPRQIKQIAASIQQFGFTNPVLISDDGEIIAGHGRVEAAKLLGYESVPTVRLSHLTPAQRRAYAIADNKLALNAGWDREILAIELQGVNRLANLTPDRRPILTPSGDGFWR